VTRLTTPDLMLAAEAIDAPWPQDAFSPVAQTVLQAIVSELIERREEADRLTVKHQHLLTSMRNIADAAADATRRGEDQ
jgi:hypothetical protein